jgi:hypothetical protein
LRTTSPSSSLERRVNMHNVSVSYMNLLVAAAGARLFVESEHLQKLTLRLLLPARPLSWRHDHFGLRSRQFENFSDLLDSWVDEDQDEQIKKRISDFGVGMKDGQLD